MLGWRHQTGKACSCQLAENSVQQKKKIIVRVKETSIGSVTEPEIMVTHLPFLAMSEHFLESFCTESLSMSDYIMGFVRSFFKT